MSLQHTISVVRRRSIKRWIFGLLAIAACVPGVDAFVPKSELWARWTAHSPSAAATIDHGQWDAFLATNLVSRPDDINRIAYAEVSEADRRRLDDYLSALSAVPISDFSRDEQRAYWINLYNALTVDVVIEHYPVDSIRKISISPGFFAIGPWKKKLIRVEDEELSLDDIEHRILRPIWKDPRIHYALNCAALGCPKLMPHAFTASNTEELLDRGAVQFINSAFGARFDSASRLIASSLYDWYQDDFGGDEAGVIAHLRVYAHPRLKTKLEGVSDVYDFDYDWTLNDVVVARKPQESQKSQKPRAGSGQR
jgi:hypothetical protein